MTVWHNFYDSISILFPAWERAFAQVALHHRDKVSDSLATRIDAFVREELSHAKAHEAYNERRGLVEEQALEFEKTEIIFRRPGKQIWLGTMVSIEHLASCIGRLLLEKLDGASDRDSNLFKWHAKEELGHKDLAIDIWRELGLPPQKLRSIAFMNQSYVLGFVFKRTLSSLDWSSAKSWVDAAVWMMWMLRMVIVPMLAIYLPNFHPSKFNDKKYLGAA